MLTLPFTAEPWGLSRLEPELNEILKKNILGEVKAGTFYRREAAEHVGSFHHRGLNGTAVIRALGADAALPAAVRQAAVEITGFGQGMRIRAVLLAVLDIAVLADAGHFRDGAFCIRKQEVL